MILIQLLDEGYESDGTQVLENVDDFGSWMILIQLLDEEYESDGTQVLENVDDEVPVDN